MEQERSRQLQKKLANEAMAILELGGYEENVSQFEQAIWLVGKACGASRVQAEEQISLISKQRGDLQRIKNGETVTERVFGNEDYNLANWSGTETFDVLMALFEASLSLDQCEDRRTLFDLSQKLIEMQSFTSWIEKEATVQMGANVPMGQLVP